MARFKMPHHDRTSDGIAFRIAVLAIVASLVLGEYLAGAVIALMLSLLVFIGEAVRDALDPRKTFA